MSIKHKILTYFRKKNLTGSHFFLMLKKINFFMFHRDLLEKKVNYGRLNSDVTFYVIRGGNKEEGLLSLFTAVLKKIIYAKEKGFIPIIDYLNYPTQYNDHEKINSWDLFFNQPSKYTLDEVYKSRNVILATTEGIFDYNDIIKKISYSATFCSNDIQFLYKIIKDNIAPKEQIQSGVEEEYKQLFKEFCVLGLFLRGTDYTTFKPKGHFIQPDIEVVKKDIRLFLGRYKSINKIFVVTEDDKIFSSIQKDFSSYIIEYDDIRFKDYDGMDYLFNAKYKEVSNYEIGLKYLKKMLLLSKCDYLISSSTNGSKFSLIMNNNMYKDSIIYDLGKY